MAHEFPADSYHWRAEYADGSYLDEHSVEGGLPFAAIDQARLVSLSLRPNYHGLGLHRLVLQPGQRVVFYRVRSVTVPLDGGALARVSVTVLGWQATIDGRNVKRLWHFGDDGAISESDGS